MPTADDLLTLPDVARRIQESQKWLRTWLRHHPRDDYDRPLCRKVGRTLLLRDVELLISHISGQIEGEIYFVGFGDYVKIGFTSRPLQDRLPAIQTGCPEALVSYATIPGTMKLERELHRRFAASRLEGEWFRKTPEMLDYIESIKKPSAREAA